jgi:hypothetical protein
MGRKGGEKKWWWILRNGHQAEEVVFSLPTKQLLFGGRELSHEVMCPSLPASS